MKATFSIENAGLNAEFDMDEQLNAQFGTVSEITKTIDNDYNNLVNKPKINAVTLVGDKSFEELGLERITNREIEELFR